VSAMATAGGIYRGITQGPTYREVLHLELDRRLAEDAAWLGPEPPRWRTRARKLYIMKVQIMRDHHARNMRWLLAEQDPRRRAIMANLIGWELPRPREKTLRSTATSPRSRRSSAGPRARIGSTTLRSGSRQSAGTGP
jgi:hypothetical protein